MPPVLLVQSLEEWRPQWRCICWCRLIVVGQSSKSILTEKTVMVDINHEQKIEDVERKPRKNKGFSVLFCLKFWLFRYIHLAMSVPSKSLPKDSVIGTVEKPWRLSFNNLSFHVCLCVRATYLKRQQWIIPSEYWVVPQLYQASFGASRTRKHGWEGIRVDRFGTTAS